MKVRCRGLEQAFYWTWGFILLRKRSHIAQAGPKFTHYVAQDSLKLMRLLPLPPQSWDHWHAPSHPGYAILRMEPRASCMLGRNSIK